MEIEIVIAMEVGGIGVGLSSLALLTDAAAGFTYYYRIVGLFLAGQNAQ